MRHRLFIHLVWTTYNRQPMLDAVLAEALVYRLPAIAKQERAGVIAVGVVSTHVHLLVRLHPSTAVPRLVQRLKGVTAHDLNGTVRGKRLRWAQGYTAESVSPRAIHRVVSYIANQPAHHPEEAIPGWHLRHEFIIDETDADDTGAGDSEASR